MEPADFKRIYNNRLNVTVNKTGKPDKSVVIFEDANAGRTDLKKVEISGLPDSCIAFTLDKAGIENDFLNKEKNAQKGINKRCDGVIITKKRNCLNIFLCEIKSDHPKPVDYEYQLISSREIVSYFTSLYCAFAKEQIKTNLKYILFRKSKKKAKIRPVSSFSEKVKMHNFNESLQIIHVNSVPSASVLFELLN